MIGDNTCSLCGAPLPSDAFGFLCPTNCAYREAAIQAARKRTPEETAAHLRSLGLHPALHRDDAVAHAERRSVQRHAQPVLDLSDLPAAGAR